MEYIQNFRPSYQESFVRNKKNSIIALLLGLFVTSLTLILINYYPIYSTALIISTLILFGYIISLTFLLMPTRLVSVSNRSVRTVEKPVIKEVIHTVEKPIIQTVEKPVITYVKSPVVKATIKPKAKSKRYKYVASKETKIYHSTRSRLAKLIRSSNKIFSNSESSLRQKGFAPSKSIINNVIVK